MITRNIRKFLGTALMCCGIAATFTGCSDEDPFFTATEDDMPRILNTDIPEGKGGEPALLKTINRTENFTFEAIVTPVHYTTVTWLIDGKQVAEGLSIDVPVMAGEHILNIVATTTKGLQTSRTCKLNVLPAEGDPYPDGSDIHETLVKQGTEATLHGVNMDKVAKVVIGGTEADVTEASDDCVKYIVPDLEDGVYELALADNTGFLYGGGTIELNHDPLYPVGGEQTLWEGEFNVTWGTPFDALKDILLTKASEGDIVRAYVSGEGGKGCISTSWWRNLETGFSDDDQGRGDTPINGDMVLEVTLSELSMSLLEQQGFYMVGDGYTLTKITIEKVVEKTLWEGEFNVTWGTPFDALKESFINEVKVGTVVRAYVSGEGGKGCISTSWWRNLETGFSDDDQGRGDTPINGDMVLEMTISELSISLLEQQGFYMVGDGYTLKKITVE